MSIKAKSALRVAGTLKFGHGMIRQVLQEQFAVQELYATCLTCRNFQNHGTDAVIEPFCTKYREPIPLHVIVNSCIEGYDDIDDIPF